MMANVTELLRLFFCMSKICSQCERGYLKGNARSHSNRATIKRQHVNLQVAKIDGRSVKVCTRCLKTASKERKVKAAAPTAKAE